MPTYEDLNRTHPERAEAEGRRLQALYSGGSLFKQQLHSFLPQHEHEKGDRYQQRCREVDYRNYVGPIIDFFTALLFSSRPVAVASVDGKPVLDLAKYWEEFREDADGHGADLDSVAKSWLTDALVRKTAWVRVHAPSDSGIAPANAKEFEERRLGDAWISLVGADRVLDWDYDDTGTLTSIVLHQKTVGRYGDWGPRNKVTETWERLTADRIETYSITYEATKGPSANDEIAQTGDRAHPFGRVPVVPLHLADGLHIAGRLELPQLSHFRLLNAFHWSLRNTCFAQPVFKIEDSDAPPIMGAGIGIMIGTAEDMEWQAPPSAHLTAHSAEVTNAKDEIFRIAHQMALGVDNNASAVGRSGESKHQDALHTKVVLLAFSRVLKEALEVIFDMISAARGEKYTWSIEGLDDFASSDIYGLIDALASVKDAGGIHSDTFNAEMEKRLAAAFLPDSTQAQKQIINAEIDAGVAEASARETELENMVGELRKIKGDQTVRPAPQEVPAQ